MLLGTIPFFRFIPETSPLYAFLDLITQVHNRPTAAFLLEEYAYTKVNEDQFRQLKLNFRGYIEEFFAVPAPIPSPNAPDSKTSSSKYIRDEIP
uniref:Uncharacterized protein n=1 Tax=Panagrolaimus sp. ES5 TaxID=591445 RepID=A0AC34GMM6_9BILA